MADAILIARPGQVLRRAIPALGVTQLIAWGTTYYLPAVLGAQFARDLALNDTAVFAGVAVTLITAACLAWPVGWLMDRQGAGRLMPAGSLLLALGLVVLSQAVGFWSYLLAWLIFGCGMSLAMSNATFSALTQMAGQGARRAIVIIMLFGGMAATVFWPLTLWLEGIIGWRNVCLGYAGLHLLVCAPLHARFLAHATGNEHRLDLKDGHEREGSIPANKRRFAAGLIAIALAGNGFVSWGLDLHIIRIFTDFGMSATVAVSLAALKGPLTMLARTADIVAAGRITPMISALIAGILILCGLLLALVSGGGVTGAVLFVCVYSLGTGLMTVARATLPLILLGSLGYATTIGRLTLPTQVIYAVSPMAYGLLIARAGTEAALIVSILASLMSLIALVLLTRLQQKPLG